MSESAVPRCFQPYLRWACDSDFSFLAMGKIANLLVEFDSPITGNQIDAYLRAKQIEVCVSRPDSVTPYRFHTLWCDVRYLNSAARNVWDRPVAGRRILRLDLTAPVRPRYSNFERVVAEEGKRGGRPVSNTSTLIGLIDDGFPVLHWRYQDRKARNRVLGLWQMDGKPAMFESRGSADRRAYQVGFPLPDVQYGVEIWREAASDSHGHLLEKSFRQAAASSARKLEPIGLNRLRTLFLDADGSLNEEDCYEIAGMEAMRRPYTHGSHVMDLAAGKIPMSARLADADGFDASPTFKPSDPANDPAANSDLICVEITRDALNDSSGRWLGSCVVDAVRYVLSFAGPKTKNVLINLSYGPTVGPHDGSSMLEAALDEMMTTFDGGRNRLKLEVFLPAGNYYRSRSHAVLKPGEAVQLRLLPGNRFPSFVEAWAKKGECANVSLKSPSITGGAGFQRYELDRMTLVALYPTEAVDGIAHNTVAQHGVWVIQNSGVNEVYLYIGRNDVNFGSKVSGEQAYFVDDGYDSLRYLRESETDTASPIKRRGTVAGIATGHGSRVAGGYVQKTGKPASYSSAVNPRSNKSIEIALPTDENSASRGLRAAGTRASSTFRLIGTSTASPLALRRLAAGLEPNNAPGDVLAAPEATDRGVVLGRPM